ncbi:hypothetical protein F6X40_24190 [Paraburkholderia sp. UCT31]|uniref:hypothetical protein n=1 Tax=Paraburkholderia sp. UCT31 TaxID=2615209 RepID=UPI001654E39E|nr:hypothetical protein [Paraburkholderia sp. UCT31]MBC8739818.1 hypothetical protein [Paraburkholderia sp. UCT31]
MEKILKTFAKSLVAIGALSLLAAGCSSQKPTAAQFNAFKALDLAGSPISCEQLVMKLTPWDIDLANGEQLATDIAADAERENHYRFRQCRPEISGQEALACGDLWANIAGAGGTGPYRLVKLNATTCAPLFQKKLAENEPLYSVTRAGAAPTLHVSIGTRGADVPLSAIARMEKFVNPTWAPDLKVTYVDLHFAAPHSFQRFTFSSEAHADAFIAAATGEGPTKPKRGRP